MSFVRMICLFTWKNLDSPAANTPALEHSPLCDNCASQAAVRTQAQIKHFSLLFKIFKKLYSFCIDKVDENIILVLTHLLVETPPLFFHLLNGNAICLKGLSWGSIWELPKKMIHCPSGSYAVMVCKISAYIL